MYKLKVKHTGNEELQSYFLSTLQEVTDKISSICNTKTFEELLKSKKECNFRFYLSFKK